MVFNSPVFLFLFLPFVLLVYYGTPKRAGNLVLLASSLLFYLWSDPGALWLMLLSLGVNYAFGLALGKAQKKRQALLVLSLGFNLVLLNFFKFEKALATLIIRHWGPDILGGMDPNALQLPLGISFFTFAAIAYQVDIYRRRTEPERSLLDFGLFFSHFAKVVAGPIERYRTMAPQLRERKVSLEDFSSGIQRFSIGLAKKVLVANALGKFVEAAFHNVAGLDTPTAWLGIACYTIQIYFDFSGYTDMAIGLGRMFGFRFMENFDYPYISRSIQEFWRRWHISLSSWLRDYLYIPLGGSRVPNAQLYANIMLVFVVCGVWHGVSWHFVVWGAYHGFFLVLERAGLARVLEKSWRPVSHLYTLFVIMIGWVFFRAESVSMALSYIRSLFTFSGHAIDYYFMNYWSNQLIVMALTGALGSLPLPGIFGRARAWIESRGNPGLLSFYDVGYSAAAAVFALFLLASSAMELAESTFSPFIYAGF